MPRRTWTDPQTVQNILNEPPWESCKDLAAKYHRSESTISNIRTGKTHGESHGPRLSRNQKKEMADKTKHLALELSTEYKVAEHRVLTIMRNALKKEALSTKYSDIPNEPS